MINLDGFQTVHMGGGKKDGTLKEKRLVLELTQQEVAEKAKISLSSYQKFENGDRNIRTASFEVACRVLKALSMDPTAFFEYKYVFGEPTIYDEEGRKYVRTGRLVDEDIDDVEAFNVKRVHIHADSIIIPLAILRAMGSPELIQILYQKSEKRLGIRILKKEEENSIQIPKTVYSGRWRGARIDEPKLISLVREISEDDADRLVVMPEFFEKGCVIALDEVEPTDYEFNKDKFYSLVFPSED